MILPCREQDSDPRLLSPYETSFEGLHRYSVFVARPTFIILSSFSEQKRGFGVLGWVVGGWWVGGGLVLGE